MEAVKEEETLLFRVVVVTYSECVCPSFDATAQDDQVYEDPERTPALQ